MASEGQAVVAELPAVLAGLDLTPAQQAACLRDLASAVSRRGLPETADRLRLAATQVSAEPRGFAAPMAAHMPVQQPGSHTLPAVQGAGIAGSQARPVVIISLASQRQHVVQMQQLQQPPLQPPPALQPQQRAADAAMVLAARVRESATVRRRWPVRREAYSFAPPCRNGPAG